MKTKIVLLLGLAIIVNSCKKNQPGVIPQLTFQSVNATSFSTGGIIVFTLKLLEQNGKTGDTLWVQRFSKACFRENDTLQNPLPSTFSGTSDETAQITFTLPYNAGKGSISSCRTDDSSYFKFWLRDAAGHISDTVQSPKIALLHN
jgi:hypothetical protein